MSLSPQCKALIQRINSLKGRFLSFDNADSFATENQEKLMSFRLLVHAEVEHFMEEYAKSIIDKLYNEWVNNRTILPALRYLFIYSPNKFEGDNIPSISDRISSCCQAFKARIENNNGIKQKNIISLFLPLGVTSSYLDNAWLATMSTFGSRRGSYAHKSIAVQNQIDKAMEINELKNVIDGLKKLDKKLQKLTEKTLRIPF
jgi:hypothetical protein